MKLDCSHRPPCPGCPELGLNDIVAHRLKNLTELATEHGATLLEPLKGKGAGYRVRARLAVRGRPKSPKIGIFQEGSHKVVDIPTCPVHHPSINEAVRDLKAAIIRTGIPPFVEGPHLGLLRYVQLVVRRQDQSVQMTLVVTDRAALQVRLIADELQKLMGDRLHSLWLNENNQRGNTIFGSAYEHLYGPEFLDETFANRKLHFHPGAFGQSNLDLAEKMAHWCDDHVAKASRAIEFHCGVGAFGLGWLSHLEHVTFNEVSPYGLMGLKEAIGTQDRVSILEGPAIDFVDRINGHDVVLCDPPRKGMEPELLQAIKNSSVSKILLVYCGFQAFLRDTKQLLKKSDLQLEELQAVVLFPHTEHVEVMALLSRSATKPLSSS